MIINRNKKGFILVQTLIYSLTGIIILAGLSLSIYYGFNFYGQKKRYTIALEAAKSGALSCINDIKNECNNSFCPSTNSYSSPGDISNIISSYYKKYIIGDYEIFCHIKRELVDSDEYFYNLTIVSRKPNTPERAWIEVGYLLK
ncbi:hypothetical protein [Thermodesulfatator indicus]